MRAHLGCVAAAQATRTRGNARKPALLSGLSLARALKKRRDGGDSCVHGSTALASRTLKTTPHAAPAARWAAPYRVQHVRGRGGCRTCGILFNTFWRVPLNRLFRLYLAGRAAGLFLQARTLTVIARRVPLRCSDGTTTYSVEEDKTRLVGRWRMARTACGEHCVGDS